MKILFRILIILTITVSCENTKSKYLDPEVLFKSDRKHLTGELLRDSIWANSFYSRIFHTQYGLLCITTIKDHYIQLLDPDTGATLAFTGPIGRGPLELINTVGWRYDYTTSTMYIGDPMLRKMVLFKISSDSIVPYDEFSLNRAYQFAAKVDDDRFVGMNFAPDQAIGVFNSEGDYLYEKPYRLIDDERMNYKQRYFNVMSSISPDNKYFVISSSWFTNFQLYSISSDTLDMVWEKMLFEPRYEYHDATKWFKLLKDSQMGFGNVYMTNKYIYLLALNQNAVEYNEGKRKDRTDLLVYDLKGKLVKNCILDNFFSLFTVSDDDKYLYGFIEREGEFYIARYKVDEM